MDISLFVQGIIIGLTLAVPVGPLALICIQRTVSEGRLHGIFSGIGVATADSFYAAVTFLGLTVISGPIIAQQYLFRFLAGVILILIGIRVFLSIPSAISAKTEHETYLKDYLSMVALAIANPLTLVFFVVILPGYSVVINGNFFSVCCGICCRSFFWFHGLVGRTLWVYWICSFPHQCGKPGID